MTAGTQNRIVETDFTFSNEKIGDYYTGVRRVLAKIFGNREVLAYVTATEKEFAA